MKRRIHFGYRRFDTSSDGRKLLSIGFRVGYWPCIYAPFIQVAIIYWKIEV